MWTYSGDPSSSTRDKVRFLIQDTDNSNQQLSDAEIDSMLTDSGSDAYAAAIRCALVLSSTYSRKADRSIGDLSISYSQIVKNYRDLISQLRLQAGATMLTPYAGGISISDKAIDEGDSDRVAPAFTRKMHDYATPVEELRED